MFNKVKICFMVSERTKMGLTLFLTNYTTLETLFNEFNDDMYKLAQEISSSIELVPIIFCDMG